jgi:hypothetical protein
VCRMTKSVRLAYQRQCKSLEDKEGPYSAPHEEEIQQALGWKGVRSEESCTPGRVMWLKYLSDIAKTKMVEGLTASKRSSD